MLWNEQIHNWKNGIVLTYPQNITKRFFYETSVCDNKLINNYNEHFIESDELEQIKNMDNTSFVEYINKSDDKYAISFYNISKDTKLVIPMPRKNRQYTTIKDFIDNASKTQQKKFWKKVSEDIENMLKTHDKIYVSTHGLGVYYFHLRLCVSPKYFHTI